MQWETLSIPEAELTRQTVGLPKVLGFPEHESPTLRLDDVAARKDELHALLAQQGAILFRNCGIDTVAQFHGLMSALGISSCDTDHYYGEVMRANTGQHTMEPTLVPPDFMIAPHNECAFWYALPEYIAFFCEQTDALYGQTPVIDCAKVAASFSAALREKLEQSLVVNEYVYDSVEASEDLVKGQKRNCWQTAYQTQDRKVVETILDARDDVDYTWRKNGTLHLQIHSRVFARHPTTGEACFHSSRAFDFNNSTYMLREFGRNQLPYGKYLSSLSTTKMGQWLSDHNWVEHHRYAWKTTLQKGPKLTDAEITEVTDTLFAHATIFRWRAGDVLLIDNVKTAHGRLNVDARRVLHVYMSEYVDQQKLYPGLSTP